MGALLKFATLLLCIVYMIDAKSVADKANDIINKSDEIEREILAAMAESKAKNDVKPAPVKDEKKKNGQTGDKPQGPPPPPPVKKDGYTGDAPKQDNGYTGDVPQQNDANTESAPPAPPSKDEKVEDEEYDKDAEIARVLSEQGDIPADETEMPEDISTHIMAVNGHYDENIGLFGGDMHLTPRQAYEQITGHTVQGDLIADDSLYWDDKRKDPSGKWSHIIVIPYRYSGAITSQYRSAMIGAVAEYNTKTCIRFVPESSLKPTPRYAIRMMVGGGCYSSVGRTGNRYQDVSLGRGCEYKGIAVHELMHALGYFHEQSRPDRDNYVRIVTANINPRMIYNFNKLKTKTQGTKYDYNSVMHYGEKDFSINGKPTIVRLIGSGPLGQRRGLSTIDALSINKIYCKQDSGGGGNNGPCGLPTDATFCGKVKSAGLCTTCTLQKACPTQCPIADKNQHCPSWAKAGFCKGSFASIMKNLCFKSCRLGATCSTCVLPTDTAFCNKVKTAGLCTSCTLQKACPTQCGINADKNTNCPRWARAGYCKRTYVAYMKATCPTSCGFIKTSNCT